MKSGTLNHIKTKRLKRLLGRPLYQVAGILEALWQVTGEIAWEHGEIGKYSDEEIADSIEWDEDAGKLIEALVSSGWMDRDKDFRLVIHDWMDHRPKYLKDRVTKRNARNKRRGITTCVEGTEDSPQAVSEDAGRGSDTTLYSQPNQTHPNQTKLNPTQPNKGGMGGAFTKLVLEELKDDVKLAARYQHIVAAGLPDTQVNRLNVFAAAERALEKGRDPPAMFRHIVEERAWNLISQPQEDRARERLRRITKPATVSPAVALLSSKFVPRGAAES